jgi:hypothetical protein
MGILKGRLRYWRNKVSLIQRAPPGQTHSWATSCTQWVHGYDDAIEKQVERFAPGFRERILAKHVMNTEQLKLTIRII